MKYLLALLYLLAVLLALSISTPSSSIGLFPAVKNNPPYKNHPDLVNTMAVTATMAVNNSISDGLIFLTNGGNLNKYDPSLIIVDNDGEPVYIKRNDDALRTGDFKVVTISGRQLLIYHEGLALFGWQSGKHHLMDNTYTPLGFIQMGNGYLADGHDIDVREDGSALAFAYNRAVTTTTGTVIIEPVIQDLDEDGEVQFEWHGLDHIPITDTYVPLTRPRLDYMHTNAIHEDHDGNILISNRNTSDIIKIDRSTGDVLWRMGGKSNEFTFANDEGFSYQHAVIPLDDRHILLFDNGNLKPDQYSRAVEYEVNEPSRTVTRTWEYSATGEIYGRATGNAQRLDNGNTIISWGTARRITEVTPDGTPVLEMVTEGISYRAFRFPWQAIPAESPRLSATFSDTVTLYTSWNGATDVIGYGIYSGDNSESMELIGFARREGFETIIDLGKLSSCAVRIRPVVLGESDLPFSPVVKNENCTEPDPERVYYWPIFMG